MSRKEAFGILLVGFGLMWGMMFWSLPPRPRPAPLPPPVVLPPAPSNEAQPTEPGSVTARVQAAFVSYENRVADAWQKLADNPPSTVSEARDLTRPLVAAARERLESDLEKIFHPALGDGALLDRAAVRKFFSDAAAGARRERSVLVPRQSPDHEIFPEPTNDGDCAVTPPVSREALEFPVPAVRPDRVPCFPRTV